MTENRKNRLTKISLFHYWRLCYRSLLFLTVLALYLYYRVTRSGTVFEFAERYPVLIGIVWLVFAVDMILRMFPSTLESPGCQKQFAKNYIPTGDVHPVLHDNNATMLVALIWIALNGIFGALYLSGIFDEGIMLLICLFYSVCDMICILYFCPFQSWFLKNKCCGSCRIYNWDYAMMFTPLFFVRRIYTWTLLLLAMLIMIRWEITVYRYPERFSEKTNAYLRCENCTEKLCSHKKQLHTLWKKLKLQEKLNETRIRFGKNFSEH